MTTLNKGKLESYVQTALWSSIDDNSEPLDSGRDIDDLAPITKINMERELNQFFKLLNIIHTNDENGDRVTLYDACLEFTDDEHIAHDFWLTRNRHGCGFWDGDYGKYGDQLTAIAQTFPEVDLYVGDDNLIYQQ
jgi:hypothetical protein